MVDRAPLSLTKADLIDHCDECGDQITGEWHECGSDRPDHEPPEDMICDDHDEPIHPESGCWECREERKRRRKREERR